MQHFTKYNLDLHLLGPCIPYGSPHLVGASSVLPFHADEASSLPHVCVFPLLVCLKIDICEEFKRTVHKAIEGDRSKAKNLQGSQSCPPPPAPSPSPHTVKVCLTIS